METKVSLLASAHFSCLASHCVSVCHRRATTLRGAVKESRSPISPRKAASSAAHCCEETEARASTIALSVPTNTPPPPPLLDRTGQSTRTQLSCFTPLHSSASSLLTAPNRKKKKATLTTLGGHAWVWTATASVTSSIHSGNGSDEASKRGFLAAWIWPVCYVLCILGPNLKQSESVQNRITFLYGKRRPHVTRLFDGTNLKHINAQVYIFTFQLLPKRWHLCFCFFSGWIFFFFLSEMIFLLEFWDLFGVQFLSPPQGGGRLRVFGVRSMARFPALLPGVRLF